MRRYGGSVVLEVQGADASIDTERPWSVHRRAQADSGVEGGESRLSPQGGQNGGYAYFPVRFGVAGNLELCLSFTCPMHAGALRVRTVLRVLFDSKHILTPKKPEVRSFSGHAPPLHTYTLRGSGREWRLHASWIGLSVASHLKSPDVLLSS